MSRMGLMSGDDDREREEYRQFCEEFAEALDNLVRLGLVQELGGEQYAHSSSD